MFDEWKGTTMIRDLTRFLDNVLQFFIDNAGDEISRARFSATQERSLGLGAMGWHAFLHKKRIAFESESAQVWNNVIFMYIQKEAIAESLQMGSQRGEAPDMKGTGRRNAHLLAIAPNANSSIICGTSPSIEPLKANAYTHRTRAGSHLVKNKYLEEILEEKGKNTDKVWTDIITNGGSVQHLSFLDNNEKDVFKTAIEIDQNKIIDQAGTRQRFLCQGQSVNLFFPAGAERKYLHEVHFNAWKREVKGLYYLRTETTQRAENVAEKVKRDALQDYQSQELISEIESQEECVACQG